ncbi:sugar ABC transporter substrate-binding protein [Streptomyces sp. RFCAC02]|uniref:sugar ABC transporter substrate-binding protein n=1 Tax=Streptomyces sp. RFCAC02 TaxID=2499143 RepID=UPI00101F7F76|nr:sugar ABC transporter substrate-binding protein [Streptomyces sp. RFCAC02]
MRRRNGDRSAVRRGLAALAALVVAAALATGCSSDSGGKRARERAEQEAAAGRADTPRITVALITHGAPGDTFWDIVRKGAEQAAAKDNADLVYAGDPSPAEQSALIDNAVDQDVDGIALTMADPEAVSGAIARAREAGIPVVGLNSGLDAWRDAGLLSYFGQDEALTGRAFGDRLNDEGGRHGVCVVHEQGNVSQEQRCGGVAETFDGDLETLYVDGTDMPAVRSTIQAKLQQDPSIDWVVALGAPFALAAVGSVTDAGSDARIATFDLNPELVTAIEDGDIAFAVDQQPYLQGYLAIDALWLYVFNGNISGGGAEPVLTGPAFIDEENVDTVADHARNGTR